MLVRSERERAWRTPLASVRISSGTPLASVANSIGTPLASVRTSSGEREDIFWNSSGADRNGAGRFFKGMTQALAGYSDGVAGVSFFLILRYLCGSLIVIFALSAVCSLASSLF